VQNFGRRIGFRINLAGLLERQRGLFRNRIGWAATQTKNLRALTKGSAELRPVQFHCLFKFFRQFMNRRAQRIILRPFRKQPDARHYQKNKIFCRHNAKFQPSMQVQRKVRYLRQGAADNWQARRRAELQSGPR
jgi:hypothetical protein